MIGPKAGLSLNLECGDVKCRKRYNVISHYSHRIAMGQHLPKQEDGGADWTGATTSILEKVR
jgi:hypothetical protein